MLTRNTSLVVKPFKDLTVEELQILAAFLKITKAERANQDFQGLQNLIQAQSPEAALRNFNVRSRNGRITSVRELILPAQSSSIEDEELPSDLISEDNMDAVQPETEADGNSEILTWCIGKGLDAEVAGKLIEQGFTTIDRLTLIDKEDLSTFHLNLYLTKKLWLAISQLHSSVADQTAVASSSSNGNSSRIASFTTGKLPKLEIPRFSGEILEWSQFWQLFDVNVNQRLDLKPGTKLSYLNALLSGNAAELIKGLPITEQSYDTAIELLQKRYGDRNATLRMLYDKLKQFKTSKYDTEGLRKLLDQWNLIVRSLETLGVDVFNNYQLIEGICSKLPPALQTQIELEREQDAAWTVPTLRRTIERMINARMITDQRLQSERSATRTQTTTTATTNTFSKNASNVSNATKRSKFTGGKGQSTPRCSLCKDAHFSDQCQKYKTLEERKSALEQRCLICLSGKHQTNNCAIDYVCHHCKAIKIHHRCLCPVLFDGKESAAKATVPALQQAANLICGNKQAPMQTALATVFGANDQSTTAHILLDCGSARSYITNDLADKLGLLPIGVDLLQVSNFGNKEATELNTERTALQLSLKNGSKMSIEVNTVQSITSKITRTSVTLSQLKTIQLSDLADPSIASNTTFTLDLLLGNDYYVRLLKPESKQYLGNGLYALDTELGWVLSGELSKDSSKSNKSATCSTSASASVLSLLSTDKEDTLTKFWRLESIGIFDDAYINDDDVAQKHFDETIKFADNRYQVRWPWKVEKESCGLPDNKTMAFKRFEQLSKKLESDIPLTAKYKSIIEDYLAQGVIEPVSDAHVQHKTHYIPHHPVVTPQKATTKVRIVFDASAKTARFKNSLNDCLYRGPVILEDLAGLLLRFRLHKTAVIADIEKAFLQIGLEMPDRDVTRFFWFKDANQPFTKDNIQVYRFKRVPFGVIASPFLLRATIRYHLNNSQSSVASQILQGLYVDNIVTGCETTTEAVNFYQEAKEVFNQASMNLREWTTNDSELLERIPEADRAEGQQHSVLGLKWNICNDSLNLASPKEYSAEAATMREAVSALSTLFDPLGWFTPATLKSKLFLQHLWKSGLSWNDLLDTSQISALKDLLHQRSVLPSLQIQRKYFGLNNLGTYELVAFSDASAVAYGAVLYLRTVTETDVYIDFLLSKSRLGPIKPISLPRMELLGVLIASRLIRFAEKQLSLQIQSRTIYTDSQCVLAWLKKPSAQDVFVTNRLKEILTGAKQLFSYVRTTENPADLLTRPHDVSDLTDFWWTGPSWLKEHTLPSHASTVDCATSPEEAEVQIIAALPTQSTPEKQVIEYSRFSSLTKLLRTVAWIILAKQKFLRFRQPAQTTHTITTQLMQEARITVEKMVQEEVYFREVENLKSGKRSDLIRALRLHLDQNGLIRCHGRIDNANIDSNAKFPTLIPTKHAYTRLVISKAHLLGMHCGTSQTLASLRQNYWIPKGRAAVKKTINECRICRKYEGLPYALPQMPPLPLPRVNASRPFEHVGIDYFGPFQTKDHDNSKFQVCIFTCATIRAIHLERVPSNNAGSFLMAVRRFIARRGIPASIISDNAKQFVLASKALNDILKRAEKQDPDCVSYFSTNQIEWKFLPVWSPWMGGFYERLIGLTKRTITKTLGKNKMTSEEWDTVLVEIETTVNSRPLTYVGEDDDASSILTPNHFLTPKPMIAISHTSSDDPDYEPQTSTRSKLIAGWNQSNKLLQAFWHMWSNQYLLSLRERKLQRLRGTRQLPPSVCEKDVVLFKPDKQRASWKLGRVTKLIKSADGEIRSAAIRFASGRTTVAPLRLLYLLEFST